ncbi:hypothetical protein DFH09DRAFT_384137 [Mycena vulgaris]|nr:hypothetical protein DFH09DRAFT_384137 [Mycena vulgaris]
MQPARIVDCELVNYQAGTGTVCSLMEMLFGEIEKDDSKEDGGSPHQQWYKSVATGTNAIVNDAVASDSTFEKSRLIAWKTDKPFKPANLFFRTVDSGRLLPMSLAYFRVQFFAHKIFYEEIDGMPGGRNQWACKILSDYLHKILVLRNMHDEDGADIPIILTSWDAARTKLALDYWVDLSKGELSDEERRKRFTECDAFCRRILPCFFQTDLLVRALLADPAVEYVPPFIIFHSVLSEGNTCVLFTKPLHAPPPALVQNWPGKCRDSKCKRSDCIGIDMGASRCLADSSAMVRALPGAQPRRIVCNLWGCEVKHAAEDSGVALQRCQRCREVLYCSRAHQTLDWGLHKNVCEQRS